MNPATATRKLLGLIRLARDTRCFLAEPLTSAEAQNTITEGVLNREQRFLQKLQTSVYGEPRNPYHKLLAAAGCEFEDVRQMVGSDGLENALGRLAAAGVSVSYDELKGHTSIKRGSEAFDVQSSDFDDPSHRIDIVGSSAGTGGNPTRTTGSLAFIEQMAPHWAVFFEEHDCFHHPLIFWTPGHANVIGRHLRCAKFGQKYVHWFVSEKMTAAKDRLYAACLRWIARRATGCPRPVSAPYDRPEIVLRSVLALLASGPVCMNTAPSAAVKLSLAAQERDVDLAGLTFMLGAEPLTPARRTAIEASGARAAPLYGSTEAPWIGGQCSHPEHPDEVHVLLDNYAVIGGGDSDAEEQPLLVTALHPFSPKILINADLADRAVIGRRRCDCLYDRMGCHATLHTIRSSDKITGYGVNIDVSDVAYVLEDALPRHVGGAVGDYQLIQEQDSNGLPRYSLFIDPRVGSVEPDTAKDRFYRELNRRRSYYGFMTAILQKEHALQIRRASPRRAGHGKLLPFLRRSTLGGRT